MGLNPGWILFIGKRYIKSRRNGRSVTPSTLSIVGIAVGVTVLISVMSVMNGMQLGFIEDILEIHSYHLRLKPENTLNDTLENSYENGRTGFQERFDGRLAERIEELPGVLSASLFRDSQTLVQGEFSEYRSALVRGMVQDQALRDEGLMKHLNIEQGEFILEKEGTPGVVVGVQLARSLGLRPGDSLQMVSMQGSSFAQLQPRHTSFVVTGIFRSGYYQYDSAFCFVGLEHMDLIDSRSDGLTLGIKIKNRFRDRKIAALVENVPAEEDFTGEIVSWRDYNRAFFGALRMEKLTMTGLLGLIFLVVAVNIKNSLERSVMEKREDVGILRAVGASPAGVKAVFVFEGWIIGFLGTLTGLPLGMVISININRVFRLVESIMNGSLALLSKLVSPVGNTESVRIFSPQTFYLQEIPVRIMFGDVFGVALFAVAVAVAAAYAASRRIAEFNPAEILRNE